MSSFMGLFGPSLPGGQERTQHREQAQHMLAQLQEAGESHRSQTRKVWVGMGSRDLGEAQIPIFQPPKSTAAKIFILGDALGDFLLPVKIHLVHSCSHLSFTQIFFFF